MKIQGFIYIVAYSLLYFLMSTILFFLSMYSGYNGLSLPIFGGGDDGQFYYEQAQNFANGEPYVYTSIHIWILGGILSFFKTDSVMVLRIFNYIANLLILVISLLILRKIVEEKAFHISAAIVTLLLAIYPSLLIISTLSIFRDVWIYAFYLWSIYLFINVFIRRGKWPKLINLLVLMMTMLMLGGYRKYALLSFLIGCMIYLMLRVLNKKKIKFFKVSSILILGLSVFYILFRDFKFPVVGLSFSDVLHYRQFNLEAGGSQMGISLDHSNIILFYLNYFYSFMSNFIGPFPWQITGGSTLLLMVSEGFVFFFISIYLVRKVKYFSNVEVFMLIQVVIWFLLISISNDNFGTGSRLRVVGWIPLIIIFAKYFGQNMLHKREQAMLKRETS